MSDIPNTHTLLTDGAVYMTPTPEQPTLRDPFAMAAGSRRDWCGNIT